MICVLGGIRESREVAVRLLDAGRKVLFSTATTIPFPLPGDPRLERRIGELDREALQRLLRNRPIRAVLDVTHPYAGRITRVARGACRRESVPYFCYLRPPALEPGAKQVTRAAGHPEAARLACEREAVVLLTIGTRSLEPYVERARAAGSRLYVRILPCPQSRETCRVLGIDDEHIISGGRVDSVENNVSLLRSCGADVLVTKDSGKQGGTRAKLAAARRTDTQVIAVERPAAYCAEVADSVEELVKKLQAAL